MIKQKERRKKCMHCGQIVIFYNNNYIICDDCYDDVWLEFIKLKGIEEVLEVERNYDPNGNIIEETWEYSQIDN